MQPCSTIRLTRVTQILMAVCVIFLSTLSPAYETTVKLADPGFRPDSEYTPAFLEALDTATIAVYPSVVRRVDRTAVSFASRNMIVNALNANNITTAITKNHRIDLGKLVGGSQWEIFEDGRRDIAAELTHQTLDADYHFVMEFLLPRNNQRIFGVHVYLLDQEGRNAFSFLLNSHHKSFIDAQLFTDDSSEEARLNLIERATDLGLHALQAQLEQAKICGTHTVAPPVIPRNGLIDGFESGLPAGTDRFGNALGFITFSDGPSTVQVSTTTDYPALPAKIRTNTVLRLNMNVNDWAGVVHVFENESSDQWAPQDWSALDELSFWFYGSNSGVRFFVDILDNRNICSTRGDAERYVYEFTDDFIGWERVFVPFKKLVRKETGNGAPNDGLTLSAVHGWAIGALNTGGSKTFYIDDVDVRKTSSGNIDYPINELPMYGGLKKTPAQLRADERYIKTVTKGGRSREAAAEIAAKTGWNLLYKGSDSSAIKRFNQAWLLNPDNQLALWGFAAISGGRNQINDAVRFFRMAIAAGPENPALERDYQYALKQLEKLMDDAAP